MYFVDQDKFDELINKAISQLPKTHVSYLKNIAIVTQEEPTNEQRLKMKLDSNQTLLGLYEGLPISARNGQTKVLPDKITLFTYPLMSKSMNEQELLENIRHTLWHEFAHYFGLNHDQIKSLE